MSHQPTHADKLVLLLARLRDPESGCRWDREQDWASLCRYTHEEVGELTQAIQSGDNTQASAQVKEELGDLLFHIAFYARIAEEQGLFTFADVVDGICDKMLERHPHVFPDGKLDGLRVATNNQPSLAELSRSWHEIKQKQKERS